MKNSSFALVPSQKLGLLAAACMALMPVASSHATVLAIDQFNYGSLTNGTATTGTGFTGNWLISNGGAPGGSDTVVAGLTYTNLPTANSAATSGNALRSLESLSSPISSGTVWVSALIKGSGNSGGDAVGIVLQGSTNNLFAGFDGGFSASNTLMGIGTASAGTVWNDTVSGFASAGNFSNTTTHLIVLELNLTTNSTKLYVDPTAGQSTPPAVPGATLSLAIGTFSGMGFNSINPNGTFDEFRVGTTFGDVVGVAAVPEPHQYALVGALLFAIAFMRRRRMVANIR